MKLSKLEKPFLLTVLSLILLFMGSLLIIVIFMRTPVVTQSWVPHVPKPIQQAIIRSRNMVSGLAQAVVPEALSSLVNDEPLVDDNIPLPANSGFDAGFRANPHGFAFRNYGNREPNGNLTIYETQELFGSRVCAQGQNETCVPLPEAQMWIDSMNGYMAAGHCAGFTIASMRLYRQELQTQFFTPDSRVTFEILQKRPAMGQIAKDWVLQTLPEVASYQEVGTPRQIVQKLVELKQPVDLGIFNRTGGGHSLLAYGLKDKGNGQYDIMVYDNNWPGKDLAIEVDYNANTWRYSIAATNPSEDPKAWEGDAKTKSLMFVPFTAYTQTMTCPFCTQEVTETEKLAIAMSGDQAVPEITTSNGERLGQFGDELINETKDGELRQIKDAMYNDRAPFLRLPMTTDFNLVMKARPNFELAITNLRMMGPGLAFAILNAQIPQGAEEVLGVSPLNQAFAYTPALPNATPIMQISTSANGLSTIATIAINGTGSPINLAISPEGSLQLGGVNGQATLVVVTVNANGTTQVFGQANMPIAAGSTVSLNIGEWNGTGPMPISIATGNGPFVPATPLVNQPLNEIVVALGSGPAIIGALSGVTPYLNNTQIGQIVEGLTQLPLTGQVLGQIVVGLNMPLTPEQMASLIVNLPPAQMAQFLTSAQLSPEEVSQVIAALNLPPAEAAALQSQVTQLTQIEIILREIEYNNFQTPAELAAYLEQYKLTPEELQYIEAELIFSGNSQAIFIEPILAAITPTPVAPTTTPVPPTPTPYATGIPGTGTAVAVVASPTTAAPTATPEENEGSGGASNEPDFKTATPTKSSGTVEPTQTPNPKPTTTPLPGVTATATPVAPTATVETPTPPTATPTRAASLALGPVGKPQHGQIVLVNNNTGLQYIPPLSFYGADSFTYTVKGYDSARRGTRQTGSVLELSLPENTPNLDVPIVPNPNATDLVVTVNVSVTNVNDNPLAVADVVTLTENSSTVVAVLANDTYLPDPPETLTVTAIGASQHGQAILKANTVYYTPTTHYVGTDSLTYTLVDENGGKAVGDITLTVTNINEAPFFVSDPSRMATEDITYSYVISATDFDLPHGDSLNLTVITAPTWLTLTSSLTGLGELTGVPTNEDIGPHDLALTVTDSQGLTATQVFSMVVLNVNTAPEFVSVPPLTATQDIAYSYTLEAVDPDTVYGDFMTFSIITAPTWLALTPLSSPLNQGGQRGVLSGIPTNNDVGVVQVAVQVSDMGNLTHTQNYSLTINNVNDAPQFASTPVIYTVQDFTYTYAISVTDPDLIHGDSWQVSILSAPAWLTLTQNTLMGVPRNGDVGTTIVSLQIMDSGGLTATQRYTLTVDDFNDLPVNTTPLTQTIQEDKPLVLTGATGLAVSDVDIDLNPLTVSLTITGGTLTLNQTTGLTFTQGTGSQDLAMTFRGTIAQVNAALATITYSPTLNFNGVVYLTMVSDDRGASFGGPVSVTNVITVNVMAVNDPPTHTLPSALTTHEDTPVMFGLGVADVDSLTDPLQVTISILTGTFSVTDGTGVTWSNNGTTMTAVGTMANLNRILANITYFPPRNITGTYDVNITTSDLGFAGSGGVLVVTGTVPITIESINDAPINTAPTVTLNMFEDSPFTFSVASGFPIQVADADSNENPIEVKLSAYHGTIALSTTANLTVTVDTQNYFIMTLRGTVTDINQALAVMTYTPKVNFTGLTAVQISTRDLGYSGLGGELTDIDDINIMVNVNNDTPIFVASPTMLTVENTIETFVYTPTATDINPEDTLTFFAPTLPSWLVLTNNGNRTATLTGTPTLTNVGAHLVELTVSDGRLTSLTQAFTITVWDAAPVFVSTPVLSVYQNVTYTYAITTTDIEGNPMNITATTLPSWLALVDNGNGTAVLSGTPILTNGGTVGTHNVVLEVSDTVSTSQQSFAITVMPPNTVVDIVADVDNSNSAPGDNSLREAIRYANAGDTITFDPVITGGIITLGSQLLINKDLTISGTVPITISGNNAVRVFDVAAGGINLVLDGLGVINGNVGAGGGAALRNGAGSTVTINNSTFASHQSTIGAGAIASFGATLVINNSTFYNNSASGNAGAIDGSGTLTIQNSTFANNSATNNGGAIAFSGPTLTTKNSTFSGNNAANGRSLYLALGAAHIYNTIMANGTGGGSECTGVGLTTNTNNLIEDGSCSPALSGDPMLGPLQNNGGTTMTVAPLPGSSVINAGNNANCLPTDQVGTTRPITGTGWYQCDIGAVEFVRPTKNLLVDITADEIEVTNGVGDNSLREAIFYSDPGDTITFDAAVSGGTITLGSQLTLNRDLTLSGTVPISISGNNTTRVFLVTAGTVTFNTLTIMNGNPASSAVSTGFGGGINIQAGTVTINNSTFTGNTSTQEGAGLNSYGTSVTINNSTFTNNSAGTYGGAMLVYNNLTVNNSTFVGNSAVNNGGAVAFNVGTVTLKNNTFANNARTFYAANSATVNATNNIFSNNTAGNMCTIIVSSGFGTAAYNLIQESSGGSCGLTDGVNGNLVGAGYNPLLSSLANNGGSTQTMALGTGSPAANVGNNATCLTTDQRGVVRPLGTCDIGAYEGDQPPIAGHYNGLQLDGVNDYLQLPSSALLNFAGNSNFSIEMWVKTTATGVMLFGKPGTVGGNVQYVFWINGSGQLQLNMDEQTGAGWISIPGTTAVNTGAWTHVALSKSGCNVNFYANGVAAGSGVVGGAQCGATASTSQAHFFNVFFGSNYLGQADELRIWNTARTQPQIQANMGRTLVGDEAGLVGYWRLEEGSGTTANDTSANALHGTLTNVGSPWIQTAQTVGPTWRIVNTAILTGTLSAIEPEGQSVTYTLVANGSQGVAAITNPSTGAFNYTPNPGAAGTDTFTYKVNDGTNDSSTQTATVEVVNLVVSTLVDTNDGNYAAGQNSLREAIANAPAGSTILFDASLSGGTITLSGSELQINKSLTISGNVPITISGNNASRVFNLLTGSANITLENLTLTNGTGSGVAINNDGNTVTLNGVTVKNNTVGVVHAAVLNNAGTLTINQSTISNNAATGAAGGLYNAAGATANINNSTIASNSSVDGAGIRNFGTLTIQNSTIVSNSSSNSMGGIGAGGTVTMRNSIVAYNTPAGQDCVGSIATNTNNLIKDGSCAPALSGDPQLGPLQNNGGATMTMMPSACSPAINAGGATTLTTDQIGNPRVVGVVDIGAVEFQLAGSSLVTVQNNSDAAIAPVGSLREAICAVATGGTVDFAAGLSGQTITLVSFIQLNRSVTITGNVPVLISGGGVDRHFRGMAGATIALNGLTLINGYHAGGNASSILNSGSTLTLNNMTIRNGTGPTGSAGQIRNVSGILTINNSAILSNTHTGGAAGAIYNSATMTINNSTIAGNVSSDGAGVRNSGGTLSIYNSTIAANTGATAAGAGIYNNSGTVNVYNTVVAYNSGAPDCSGTIATNVSNLIEDGSCSPAFSGDPLLGPLQNNGSSTLTMSPLCGSPVIDAAGAGALATDQIGQAVSNGTRDLGAFEYQMPASTANITVINTSNSGSGSLRDAICLLTAGGTINFAAGLSGQTITLASELVINKSLTISGNVPINISGNNAVRVFNLGASATNVTLNSLTLANGYIGTGAGGGGVYVSSASNNLTINNSTLRNNTAGWGGAILNSLGNVTINNSTFLTNSATSWEGGAIYNQTGGSILTVNNSTFYGNSAAQVTTGGGVLFNNSTATIINSTLANNIASSGFGGGIYNTDTGTLNLKNTIIANSTGTDCYNSLGTIATNINNLIEDRTCNVGTTLSGYVSGEPNLGPLQNNGGSTLTMAPLANSAALSRGNSATCLTTDQTGMARPQPITATTCDMGAVESALLPPTPGPFGYVPNWSSDDVYVIDTSVNAVVKTIAVGTTPRGMAISPDGTRVYVTNYGSNNVSVIDTSSNTVIATVNVGGNPYGVTFSLDSTRAYVANYNGSGTTTVSVIDTSSNTIVTTLIMGGNGAAGIAITPDGTRAYVVNYTSDSVSVVDTSNNSVITTFAAGSGANGVAVSPNGARVYVANINANTVSVIDTSSNSVVATISVGTAPRSLIVTPDGTKLYVTNSGSNNISVIDTNSNTVVATLAVPSGEGSAITPDGRYVYVPGGTNKVSVIDTSTNAVVASMVIGTNPFFLGQFITPLPLISSAVVDTLTDNGLTACTAAANDCSLRGAITRVSSGGTITFDPSLSGGTITLGSALGINKSMTISGNVPINISGNNAVRVFRITAGPVTLDNLTIANGVASGGIIQGGGIHMTSAAVTINNSTITNNSAPTNSGGGVYNFGGTLTINNSTIANNISAGLGSGVSNNGGSLTVNNSTFVNNTGANDGGGIANLGGGAVLVVNNSTFVNNSAANGGGLECFQGTATIKNSTFSGNSASSMGGGIYNSPIPCVLHLYNTIIANSTAGGDCVNAGTLATNTNNLIEDGSCSPALAVDPQLGLLQNNGGNTSTMALGAGSPAINAGNFATCLSTDQRGMARGASQCDIGAFEYNTASRPTPVGLQQIYLPLLLKK